MQQKIDNSVSAIVAIFTNPHIFYYLEGSTRSCVDEPQCNSQLLAMVTEMKHLFFFVFFFFFHIVLNKFSTKHVPIIMHEPWQSLPFCTVFNHLRVVLIIYYKPLHLILQFNLGATRLFLRTIFLSQQFKILTEMPVASSSMAHNKHHLSGTISRICLATHSAISTLPWFPRVSSKAIHAVWCSFTGHCHDHILCLL